MIILVCWHWTGEQKMQQQWVRISRTRQILTWSYTFNTINTFLSLLRLPSTHQHSPPLIPWLDPRMQQIFFVFQTATQNWRQLSISVVCSLIDFCLYSLLLTAKTWLLTSTNRETEGGKSFPHFPFRKLRCVSRGEKSQEVFNVDSGREKSSSWKIRHIP